MCCTEKESGAIGTKILFLGKRFRHFRRIVSLYWEDSRKLVLKVLVKEPVSSPFHDIDRGKLHSLVAPVHSRFAQVSVEGMVIYRYKRLEMRGFQV